MKKMENRFWRFLASIKLALVTLILLAATSIIGTLIKQGKPSSFYVEEYGAGLARFFEISGFTDMYTSWWFVALLLLFSVNLVVCSIERLPAVWRMVVLNNLATDPGQLEKMSSSHRWTAPLKAEAAAERLQRILAEAGWKRSRRRDWEESILLFAQKGAWTRLGVYIVHLSILVILVGAMIGAIFGFQAYVFLPEGKTTSHVFLRENQEPFPLGFELRCDRFEKTYYPNGMVKQFRSDLTVIDQEQGNTLDKTIVVNDPLSYRGFTFYQGDAYPMEEFFVVIGDPETGREQAFRVPPDRDVEWPGTDITFRIEELSRDQEGVVSQAGIRFQSAASGGATTFRIQDRDTVTVRLQGREYAFSFRQLYSTLLLIKKDPGVSVLFSGCILLVVGLAVVFFLSHRRIWILLNTAGKQGSGILLSGAANKNRPAFERRFQDLVDRAREGLSGSGPGKRP